jgi:hypothetical protein
VGYPPEVLLLREPFYAKSGEAFLGPVDEVSGLENRRWRPVVREAAVGYCTLYADMAAGLRDDQRQRQEIGLPALGVAECAGKARA